MYRETLLDASHSCKSFDPLDAVFSRSHLQVPLLLALFDHFLNYLRDGLVLLSLIRIYYWSCLISTFIWEEADWERV